MVSKQVCVLLCCVATTLMVGVHASCFSISPPRAFAAVENEWHRQIKDAYSQALAELSNGECTEIEALATVKAKVAKTASAFVQVFIEAKAQVNWQCEGTADEKAKYYIEAAAKQTAGVHVMAVTVALYPYGYPIDIFVSEWQNMETILEPIFADAYSRANGQVVDYDMDEQAQNDVIDAVSKAFAKEIAKYYC